MTTNPTPAEIKALRKSLGLSQTSAAKLVYCRVRALQQWESGDRKMSAAHWHLFRVLTAAMPRK